MEPFAAMLAGGHPNSLGRTVEVVGLVLADERRLDELFGVYAGSDAVARLRASNALKRLERERHALLVPHIDRLIDEVGALDQPSAQWTLAQLFLALSGDMKSEQKRRATALLRGNLERGGDWIVLNMTLETLGRWAQTDSELRDWLAPHAGRLARDRRKSVASRAAKLLKALSR